MLIYISPQPIWPFTFRVCGNGGALRLRWLVRGAEAGDSLFMLYSGETPQLP